MRAQDRKSQQHQDSSKTAKFPNIRVCGTPTPRESASSLEQTAKHEKRTLRQETYHSGPTRDKCRKPCGAKKTTCGVEVRMPGQIRGRTNMLHEHAMLQEVMPSVKSKAVLTERHNASRNLADRKPKENREKGLCSYPRDNQDCAECRKRKTCPCVPTNG